MRRIAAKSWPERLILAAIILSCGLVMSAEPPATLKADKAGGSFQRAASRPGHGQLAAKVSTPASQRAFR